MDRAPVAIGVCVVRIEQRGPTDVLVTVRGSLDVADPAAEWVVRTGDVARARSLVDGFLADFLAGRRR
jgi:hypothetical protein